VRALPVATLARLGARVAAIGILGSAGGGCAVYTRAPVRVRQPGAYGVAQPGVAQPGVAQPGPERRGYACQPPPEHLKTVTNEFASIPLLAAGIATIVASPAVSMSVFAPVHAASPNNSAGTIAAVAGLAVAAGGGVVMTIIGGHRVRVVRDGDVSFRIGPGSVGLGTSF
jgi:hypothetical protein